MKWIGELSGRTLSALFLPSALMPGHVLCFNCQCSPQLDVNQKGIETGNEVDGGGEGVGENEMSQLQKKMFWNVMTVERAFMSAKKANDK